MIAAEQTTVPADKTETVTDVATLAHKSWFRRNLTLVVPLAGVVVAAAAGGWFGVRPYLRSRTLAASSFLNTQVTKLTSDGNIQLVRVSPRGNFVAMAVGRGDLSALRGETDRQFIDGRGRRTEKATVCRDHLLA